MLKIFTPYRRAQLTYVLIDTLASIIIWLLFLLFRWLVYDGYIFSVDTVLIPAFKFTRALRRFPVGCLLVNYLLGYYLQPYTKTYAKDFLYTLLGSVIIAFSAFFIIIIDDHVESYQRYIVSLIVLFGIQFCVSYFFRLMLKLIGGKRHQKEREIVILENNQNESELYKKIAELYPKGVEIGIKASTFDVLSGAAKIRELNANPVVMVTDPKMSDWQISLKRNFDIVVSLLSLVLLSPLFLIIALRIKMDSPGPIIYCQERVGLYGKPFNILKFRTMYVDAEQDTPLLSSENDPRITKIGRILRPYRLDELPQFFNVLIGDMSIVGPRPERQYYIDKITEQAPYYCLIYSIRPGLTSWGPIKVGYADTIEKMVKRLQYDIAYMENMSLWLDAKILFKTVKVILDGKGQ